MNQQLSINVKSPCSENFQNFSPTKNGGFCSSCTKEVIDFSTMETKEVIQYFQTSSKQNTCGRFRTDQLGTTLTHRRKRNISFISRIGISVLALFSFYKVQGQDLEKKTDSLQNDPPKFQDTLNDKLITVEGNVNEGGYPLPGVNILLEGTTIGVATDFDGNFTFPKQLKKGDVLVFSYIGMNSRKVEIQNDTSKLNVSLQVNMELDECIIMGKVAVKGVFNSAND